MLEFLFNRVADLKDWNLIKKRPNAGVFLRILRNFYEQLL